MSAHVITHRQAPLYHAGRNPLDMPSPKARAILQSAEIALRQIGADTRCLATVALADAIEEIAGGETEAACEALAAAAALREMRQ